jgi:hypothetical protein
MDILTLEQLCFALRTAFAPINATDALPENQRPLLGPFYLTVSEKEPMDPSLLLSSNKHRTYHTSTFWVW